MSEKAKIAKELYHTAVKLGSDRSISPQEASQQLKSKMETAYSAADDYEKCRKQRKADIAQRLHELRSNSGLRQQDVAEKLGISYVTLSGYEIGRNEASAEALVRLANVYDVSLDYLMCRTDVSDTPNDKKDAAV